MLSSEMVRECSDVVEERESQFETREKDFFFLRGGCCWSTSGNGGGGRSSRRGDFGGGEGGEMVVDEDAENAAEASVKDFKRIGMCTVFFDGAVLGRWSASARRGETRSANDG